MKCEPTEHRYKSTWSHMEDSKGEALLFCTRCGDVIFPNQADEIPLEDRPEWQEGLRKNREP